MTAYVPLPASLAKRVLLRERAQGDKAAAIESASKGQYDLFAPKGAA